jgi:hypothetical protein
VTLLETRPEPVAAALTAPVEPVGGPDPDQSPQLRSGRVLVAALLATSAAGWMAGGVFVELLARLVAVVAGAVGVGGVAWAVRRRRVFLQYLLAPAGIVLGYLVALVLPNATGVTGTVPHLVRSAINNGGLAEPPIPFDPGWRFLVVVLLVFVGAASASLATSFGKPRLGILVPLPVVVAGALNQPPGRDLASGGLALVLLVAALLVSYTAELSEEAEGGVSRAFEVRQLLRGGAAMVAVLVVLGGLSQASLLFPVKTDTAQEKPQRPKVQPLSAVKDRPLFDVASTLTGPWRLGVLDEYDGTAWLLPPFDLGRAVDPGPDGGVPGPHRPTTTARFRIRDLGGFTLPAPPGTVRIHGAKGDVGFDPRTQVFRARRGAPGDGFTYTVEAGRLPNGTELRAAAGALPRDIAHFTKVPDPPVEVTQLLAAAPTNPFERVQSLRAKLYSKVVAAGSGVPVDVSPARVVAMLRGGDATPYEIVAGEALLARWSGLPARIGYGFNGGSPIQGGREFRPRDGANWLEVYIGEQGWVPILGTPPKARSSLTTDPKNQKPTIRPSDELTLQVYLPLESTNPLQFFEIVRYWLKVAAPFAAGLVLLLVVFPWPVKLWRSRRRRRWATGAGLPGRIAVAYAEFRDTAIDLGIGFASATPLDFLDATVPDDEHAELAWLVTRTLWGDLVRDLREEDAEAAEVLAASLRKRLVAAAPVATRAGALVSKASLRKPYDDGLPNPWRRRRAPRPVRPARLRAALRRLRVRAA